MKNWWVHALSLMSIFPIWHTQQLWNCSAVLTWSAVCSSRALLLEVGSPVSQLTSSKVREERTCLTCSMSSEFRPACHRCADLTIVCQVYYVHVKTESRGLKKLPFEFSVYEGSHIVTNSKYSWHRIFDQIGTNLFFNKYYSWPDGGGARL